MRRWPAGLSLAASLLLSACAAPRPVAEEDRYQRPVPKDEAPFAAEPAPKTDPAPREEPAPRRPPPPRATPTERARAAKDDIACTREVLKSQGRGDNADAFAMLQACVSDDKFRKLQMLYASPWRELIVQLGDVEAASLVAHVIATRGASAADIASARENHFQIYDLKTVIKNPGRFTGRLILVRGTVSDQRSGGPGVTIVEFAETMRGTQDHMGYVEETKTTRYTNFRGEVTTVTHSDWNGRTYGKSGSSDISIESGRSVTAYASNQLEPMEPEREYVILARFQKVSRATADDGEVDNVKVQLLRWYHLGVELPDISR